MNNIREKIVNANDVSRVASKQVLITFNEGIGFGKPSDNWTKCWSIIFDGESINNLSDVGMALIRNIIEISELQTAHHSHRKAAIEED